MNRKKIALIISIPVILLATIVLVKFRGDVLLFSLVHADEVRVAKDSYNAYHEAATEAYRESIKGRLLSPVPDDPKVISQ